MRNQEIAKGLRLIAEGFTTLAVAYEKEPVVIGVDMANDTDKVVKSVINTTTKEVVKQEEVKPIAPVQEEVKEESKPEAVGTFPTEEELNALSYNDLKAKAKELGVKAVGSKKVIMENILALNNNVDVVEEAPEVADTVAKELPVEDRGEQVEVDEEALPEEANTLYDQVALDVEGYSDEELADILSEIGVSPKGRRQALLAKIVQAIEDGKLEWEEESTETLDAPQEATNTVEEEPEADEIEVDEEEFNGTEARKHACYEECDKIELQVGRNELSHKEIIKYLKEYNNGKYVSQGEDADIDEYMAIQCDLIDDEGTKHDLADPYYIGDDIYCCGQHLKDLNDDLYCEVCGTTYEAN